MLKFDIFFIVLLYRYSLIFSLAYIFHFCTSSSFPYILPGIYFPFLYFIVIPLYSPWHTFSIFVLHRHSLIFSLAYIFHFCTSSVFPYTPPGIHFPCFYFIVIPLYSPWHIFSIFVLHRHSLILSLAYIFHVCTSSVFPYTPPGIHFPCFYFIGIPLYSPWHIFSKFLLHWHSLILPLGEYK